MCENSGLIYFPPTQVHVGPSSVSGASNNITILGSSILLGSAASNVDILANQLQAFAEDVMLSSPSITFQVLDTVLSSVEIIISPFLANLHIHQPGHPRTRAGSIYRLRVRTHGPVHSDRVAAADVRYIAPECHQHCHCGGMLTRFPWEGERCELFHSFQPP